MKNPARTSGVESGLGDLTLLGLMGEERFVTRLPEDDAVFVECLLELAPRIALRIATHECLLEITHDEIRFTKMFVQESDEADELHLESRGSDRTELTFECVETRPELLLFRCLGVLVECGHNAVVFGCECEQVTCVDYSLYGFCQNKNLPQGRKNYLAMGGIESLVNMLT